METEPDLLDGERIDDLQRGGCRIIQNSNLFCFGMDAVLLAAFADVRKCARVLDLCSGNGVIPLLMDARMKAVPDADDPVSVSRGKTSGRPQFTGVEINPVCVDMAVRSAAMNGQQDRVHFIEADIREFRPSELFDAVTVNPPYMTGGAGLTGKNRALTAARHEVLCTIEDVASAAARSLRPGGRIFMVHRPHRLMDICRALSGHKLEVKRLRMVHPFSGREANMVLIEAVLGGRPYLHVEKPLIIYNSPGIYTQEVRDIYG